MPNYKGHLVGGLLAFVIVLQLIIMKNVHILVALEWLCFTLLGSLFPDIDIKSKGQKIFYRTLMSVLLFLALKKQYAAIALLSILSCIPIIVPHRGICHRLWFVVAAPFSIALCSYIYFRSFYTIILWDAFFFSVGAISHLWLDLGVRKMLRVK